MLKRSRWGVSRWRSVARARPDQRVLQDRRDRAAPQVRWDPRDRQDLRAPRGHRELQALAPFMESRSSRRVARSRFQPECRRSWSSCGAAEAAVIIRAVLARWAAVAEVTRAQ